MSKEPSSEYHSKPLSTAQSLKNLPQQQSRQSTVRNPLQAYFPLTTSSSQFSSTYNSKGPGQQQQQQQQCKSTYKTIKVKTFNNQPLTLFDHATYLNQQNQQNRYQMKGHTKHGSLSLKYQNFNRLQLNKNKPILQQFLQHRPEPAYLSPVVVKKTMLVEKKDPQIDSEGLSPINGIVYSNNIIRMGVFSHQATNQSLDMFSPIGMHSKNPSNVTQKTQKTQKTPFQNEKLRKSEIQHQGGRSLTELSLPLAASRGSNDGQNYYNMKQIFAEKVNNQREQDTLKMKEILKKKYKDKMKLLELKYSEKMELSNKKDPIKEEQVRRIFSQGNLKANIDGRLSHISTELEPQLDNQYQSNKLLSSTQSTFKGLIKKQQQSNLVRSNKFNKSGNHSNLKQAYLDMKLQKINETSPVKHKFFSQRFLQQSNNTLTGLSSQYNFYGATDYDSVLKETGDLITDKKQEQFDKEKREKIDEIEQALQKKRIVNVTLDSDLDQPIVPTQNAYAPIESPEQNESEKWMKRYNQKKLEGKIFKLKQNLNLVLDEMQKNQIKITTYHSSACKAVDDIEEDLLTLENMRRLNEQTKGKRRLY